MISRAESNMLAAMRTHRSGGKAISISNWRSAMAGEVSADIKRWRVSAIYQEFPIAPTISE
jgi:hypothetical protein